MLKIVNCATIKETRKLKETMVGVQVVLVSCHQYPPRSGSLASRNPGLVLFWLFHEIPHSCLEYGAGVIR